MSFPSFSDLSEEQLDVYSFDNNIPLLIKGGPGSGKTVMALWRSNNLIENSKKVSLLMYNNTLLKFTKPHMQTIVDESGTDRNLYDINTVDSYLIKKYQNATGYRLRIGDYSTLLAWSMEQNQETLKNFFGSYFVVDEGQDFPNDFYSLLAQAWAVCRPEFCPTILADENQQIVEGRNSTIKDIKEKLGWVASSLGQFGEKELTYNYRNTKEIAAFANTFYDGLDTNPPTLPNKISGIKPKYFSFKNIKRQAERIVQYKKNNPDKTIGVLIAPQKSSYLRKAITEAIRDVIDGDKDIDMSCLQQYASMPEFMAAGVGKKLDFSSTGKITVLTRQSCKGLEFDTVFLSGLESMKVGTDINLTKRNLYVLSTRARSELFLFSNTDNNTLPEIMTEGFFKEIISGGLIDMGQNNHPLSNVISSQDQIGAIEPSKLKEIDSMELIIEKNEFIDPDNPKYLFKKVTGTGLEEVWCLISLLVNEGEPIVNIVLIANKETSYLEKLKRIENATSIEFSYSIVGNTLESRSGKKINIFNAESINTGSLNPMIFANLEDVTMLDKSTQKSLKNIIDNTLNKAYFLLCKGMTEDESVGLKMLKSTGDLRIIEDSDDR